MVTVFFLSLSYDKDEDRKRKTKEWPFLFFEIKTKLFPYVHASINLQPSFVTYSSSIFCAKGMMSGLEFPYAKYSVRSFARKKTAVKSANFL